MFIKLRVVTILSILLASPIADAAVINLASNLDSFNEVPSISLPGAKGDAAIVLDTSTGEFGWVISFEGLTGPAVSAHFHEAMKGSTGSIVLNLDTDSGVVLSGIGQSEGVFAGGTILDPTQISNVLDGLWYINIHTAVNPTGEIRGQVQFGSFTPVPVPAAIWLLVSGVLVMFSAAKRQWN